MFKVSIEFKLNYREKNDGRDRIAILDDVKAVTSASLLY